MFGRLSRYLAACLAAVFFGMPAGAGSGTTLAPEMAVQAVLLPGWRQADGTHMAALHLSLAPGWKTYWRAPGEGGIPPVFTWRGSRNLVRATPRWPRPYTFRVNGLQSVGYAGELVLPLLVTPADPNAPIRLDARVDLGVCEDVCLPVTLQLRADLPAPGTRDRRIVEALAAQPQPARKAGVSAVSCTLTPIKDGLRVTARIAVPALGGAEETVIFEQPDPEIWVGEATTRREGSTLVATSDLVSYAPAGVVLDRSRIRLTLLGDRKAVDIQGCPAG